MPRRNWTPTCRSLAVITYGHTLICNSKSIQSSSARERAKMMSEEQLAAQLLQVFLERDPESKGIAIRRLKRYLGSSCPTYALLKGVLRARPTEYALYKVHDQVHVMCLVAAAQAVSATMGSLHVEKMTLSAYSAYKCCAGRLWRTAAHCKRDTRSCRSYSRWSVLLLSVQHPAQQCQCLSTTRQEQQAQGGSTP